MRLFEVFAAALAAFYAVVPSLGLSIILLTVAVRVVLLPLSVKQTRSMREMQKIQPEVKKLQAKYKGNRQKMNEEVMKLYREHGVNPLGGCLPMLLQIPVMIGLFNVLRSPLQYMSFVSGSKLVEDLQERPLAVNQFLGIRLDCGASASLAEPGSAGADPSAAGAACGGDIFAALPYILLLLGMAATTYLQQKQMQAAQVTTSDAQAQQMRIMNKVLPVMLLVAGFGFPAGVLLYWLVTNLWGIGQQYLMQRGATPATATASGHAVVGARAEKAKPAAGKPAKGKPSKSASSAGKERTAKARATPPKRKKR